jgi:hypothetical protein
MLIKKTQIADFKDETLNMWTNDFTEAYLKDLINTKYDLCFTVNGIDKLTTHVWHENKCEKTTFKQFLDFCENNQEIVKIIELQSKEYSLYSEIENRIGWAMSKLTRHLKNKESVKLENFTATMRDEMVNSKIYTYKDNKISNWYSAKNPEKVDLNKLREEIKRLEIIKEEADNLFNKYYQK